MACQYFETKVNRVKEVLDSYVNAHPESRSSNFVLNIANMMSNSGFNNANGHKTSPTMRQYYDKWFTDINCNFSVYMSDSNVVAIINEAF